jgi:dihydroxy-acid dehydratase
VQLNDEATFATRAAKWRAAAEANGGVHPDVRQVSQRVLRRMRATALPALSGGGMIDD